jgi:hypothetical protein
MKAALIVGILFWQAIGAVGQQGPAAAAGDQRAIHRGIFAVELKTVLDTSKVKVGDEVAAALEQGLLRGGKVFAPVGTRVLGRVTDASAWSKEDREARLQVTFEKLVMSDGTQISFQPAAVIQALAPDKRAIPKKSTAGGRDFAVTVLMDDGVDPRSFEPYPRGAARSSGAKMLTPSAHGALYLPGVALKDGLQGPVIVAKDKDVKLGQGTQMEITIPAEVK